VFDSLLEAVFSDSNNEINDNKLSEHKSGTSHSEQIDLQATPVVIVGTM
jgi:hypothetical protein